MSNTSYEAKRKTVSTLLEQLADADPWADAACIHDEKRESVLNCLLNTLPDSPTFADINGELNAIRTRGDGSVFRSRGEAHAALLSKHNGCSKLTVPMTSEIKSKLKAMSASERLEVANKLTHEQMNAGTKI